jgi:hypothetical protein
MRQPERIWEGGLLRAAGRLGVPAGLAFGLLQFASNGSVPGAIFGGALLAVVAGASMALAIRRRWSRSSELTSHDRVAVARAVHRGEDVGSDHLAPAVIAFAEVVRRAQERNPSRRWVLPLFACLSLFVAVTSTIDGSSRQAVIYWLITAFWVVGITWWFPRQRARSTANAQKAELAARRRLGSATPADGATRPPADGRARP